MSDRYSGQGAGKSGSKEYFTEGRGPGRGMDVSRSEPKQSRRGVGNGDPILIDLEALNQPGVGPVDTDELARGRIMPRLTTVQLGHLEGDVD